MSYKQFFSKLVKEMVPVKTFVEDYLDEHADDEYCMYCGKERSNRAWCCGEVHFIRLADMEHEEKMAIIEAEYSAAFGDKK